MAGLKLVMLGTGDFAVPSLRAMYHSPHEVLALYTQPERTGPGHHQAGFSRIKTLALEHSTPVRQPVNVNAPDALADLQQWPADLFVVAAYGQILSPALLAIPPRGTVNVHGSLLPRFRGASPVEYAVWQGDAETGVTIIGVEPQLDAGPIFGVVRTPIGPRETAGELEARLAELAAPLLIQVLDDIAAGRARGEPQNPAEVTRAPKLKKSQGRIDWSQTPRQIDCQVRAMQPWPKAFSYVYRPGQPEQRLILLEVEPADRPGETAPPGHVLAADKQGLIVATGNGSTGHEALRIVRVQPEGKRAMTAAEFLRGTPCPAGTYCSAPASP